MIIRTQELEQIVRAALINRFVGKPYNKTRQIIDLKVDILSGNDCYYDNIGEIKIKALTITPKGKKGEWKEIEIVNDDIGNIHF